MFNFSGSEIVFLLLLALIVLGPEKLPEAVRKFGKTYAEFKKVTTGFQTELKSALDEPMREMRETAEAFKKAAQIDVDFDHKALFDSTTTDTGSTSAAQVDAAPVDAGPVDAAPVDAGPVDAAQPDADAAPVADPPFATVKRSAGLPFTSAAPPPKPVPQTSLAAAEASPPVVEVAGTVEIAGNEPPLVTSAPGDDDGRIRP